MEWLNYHHLLYFWVVAKEGSIVRASKQLRLAHPTISGQIHPVAKFIGSRNRSTACPSSSPAATRLLRRTLEQWFDSEDVKPKIVGELDDSALSKVLGEAGYGIFAAPDVIEEDVRRRYKVQLVGRAEDLRQRFYAISVERRLKHPAVVAICEAARKHIFA